MSEWVDAKTAAMILRCSRQTVHRWARYGVIQKKHIRGERTILYNTKSFSEVIRLRENRTRFKKAGKAAKRPRKKKSIAIKIEAICPRCKKMHLTSRQWAGTGTPRFYCPKCAVIASGISSGLENKATY